MLIGMLLCGLAAGGSLSCRREPAIPEVVRPVRWIRLADAASFRAGWLPGRAEAGEEVDLAFRVSGPLIGLPVRIGSSVQAGELLAAIDPTEYRIAVDRARANLQRAEAELSAMERGARPEEIAQLQAGLAEAEASLTQASADHERNIGLRREGAVSQSEFDLSLARRDRSSAQVTLALQALRIGQQGAREEDRLAKRAEIAALAAAVEDAENRLRYTSLTAPFAGEVAGRFVDNFQTIQAQQPVLRLLNKSQIKIVVQVPESAISLATLVTAVNCRFDAIADRLFTGRVHEIGREASRTTRTFPVTVLLDPPEGVNIFPGMAASVQPVLDEAALAERQHLTIPVSAVFTVDTEKQSCVWVIDPTTQQISRRQVEVGPLTPLGLALLSGLVPGEQIVTAGVHSLREGQRVRLLDGPNGNDADAGLTPSRSAADRRP
jgi:RND family efflux transporter MFP subunit